MWSELAADARLSSRLRWPDRDSSLRRVLIWLRSRGLLVLALQRVSHRYMQRRAQLGWTLGLILTRLLIGLTRRPIMMVTKCDVGETIDIAPGVYLSDCGFLILGMASIGSGTLIHERVTIGPRAGDREEPVIGANVWIGPDCVIYGDLGNGATVLPGSVVSIGVPSAAVAAGNPATIIRRQFDNAALRRTLARDIDSGSLAPG
ncbi:MAG: acyltransferase [Steroidobacteraceae bacterium]